MKDEKINNSRIAKSSPKIINNMLIVSNLSDSFRRLRDIETFNTKDRELLDILEELGNVKSAKEHDVDVKSLDRLSGSFCLYTIFNLSHRVLSDAEIKVLKKGSHSPPIQSKIDRPELLKDSGNFCHCVRAKWHFWNEPSKSCSKKPHFSSKSNWKPPEGLPNLEVFLC